VGYADALAEYISEGGTEEEFQEDICTNLEEATSDRWPIAWRSMAGNVLPFKEGKFEESDVDINYKVNGDFDFDSIMLYTSFQGGPPAADRSKPVMTRKTPDSNGNNFWFKNTLPSQGDIVAVKQLYPDVTGDSPVPKLGPAPPISREEWIESGVGTLNIAES
jgi:hypothetical protein